MFIATLFLQEQEIENNLYDPQQKSREKLYYTYRIGYCSVLKEKWPHEIWKESSWLSEPKHKKINIICIQIYEAIYI